MRNQTGAPSAGSDQTEVQVRYALAYSKTAAWAATLALLIVGIAVGPTVFRGVGPTGLNAWSIGLLSLLVVATLAEVVLIRRSNAPRARVLGLLNAAASSFCLLIVQVSSANAVRVAFVVLSAIFMAAALRSFWHLRRNPQ